MKEKLLTSNDFHNEWEKIGEKHDKIINCCGIPKLERRWHTREKFSNYETALQQLLNKVDEAKHIAEEKIMNSLHPDENFRRDDETEALLQLSLGIYADVHSVQESRVGVEEFFEIDDWDDFPKDWTPICRREEECCEKTNHATFSGKKTTKEHCWKC